MKKEEEKEKTLRTVSVGCSFLLGLSVIKLSPREGTMTALGETDIGESAHLYSRVSAIYRIDEPGNKPNLH